MDGRKGLSATGVACTNEPPLSRPSMNPTIEAAAVVRDRIQLVRGLSNELAADLHSMPSDIWRDAERYPSGCEQWHLADVVAHLNYGALGQAIVVRRALRAELSHPMAYLPLCGANGVGHIVRLREAYSEDLVPEFNATCKELNGIFVELTQESFRLPAWTYTGESTISALIDQRAVELAIHGWDIRYGIDRWARLSELAVPFIKAWAEESIAARRLSGSAPAQPVTYRFLLEDAPADSRDVKISQDCLRIAPPSAGDADVTFRCDTNAYLLLMVGRLPFSRYFRRGRLAVEGDELLAKRFPDWFQPL